jgi:hypothetical protein
VLLAEIPMHFDDESDADDTEAVHVEPDDVELNDVHLIVNNNFDDLDNTLTASPSYQIQRKVIVSRSDDDNDDDLNVNRQPKQANRTKRQKNVIRDSDCDDADNSDVPLSSGKAIKQQEMLSKHTGSHSRRVY